MNNPTNTHEAPTQSHRLSNPWKGLDSYQETDRLYGRDEEIELLFSRIEYNIQTVVYSRSGIGKSSIINAGIFPKARQA
jgi:putative ribosome biogenesis GTPase RsgA